MRHHLALLLWFGCGLPLLGACGDGQNGAATAADASAASGGSPANSGGITGNDGAGGVTGTGGHTTPDASFDAATALPDASPDAGGDATRPTPFSWTRTQLPVFTRGIGGARDEVWVVGEGGGIVTSRGDDVWIRRITDTGARLTGAWGTGPDDVYVSVYQNFVLHWKGGQWQHEFRGIAAGTIFLGVWGRAADEVYALSGAVLRSSGDGLWTQVPIADQGSIQALWTAGPNDFWTIDNRGVVNHVKDGQRSIEKTAFTRGIGIWGSGPSDIYALCIDGISHSRGDGKWTVEVRFDTMHLGGAGVWGAGSSDVSVVTQEGQLWRSRGDGQWWPEVIDPALASGNDVVGIWGADARNVYVATYSAVYHGR
jgi:hypothetical protein